MIFAYLLVLLGITGVIWSAKAGLAVVGLIGGALLVVAVQVAYGTGKRERR